MAALVTASDGVGDPFASAAGTRPFDLWLSTIRPTPSDKRSGGAPPTPDSVRLVRITARPSAPPDSQIGPPAGPPHYELQAPDPWPDRPARDASTDVSCAHG
jgi:hypothetical protein